MTLADARDALFEKYGYYAERTINLMMPGLDGLKKMKDLMDGLRANPPADIGGTRVSEIRDYLNGIVRDTTSGTETTIELSGSNVLRYGLDDGTAFIVRPSGTEPKVKVYILTKGESAARCDEKIERYAGFAEELKK